MKLYNDETSQISAQNFWIIFQGKKFYLPVSQNAAHRDETYTPDLDAVNGIYKLYICRQEDNQLNWSTTEHLVVAGTEAPPMDTDEYYYKQVSRIRVSDFQHDGVNILNPGVAQVENGGKLDISFIDATRININMVMATYIFEGDEFAVEWNNVHPGNGEIGNYDLQPYTRSHNEELAARVNEAIRIGETDDNPDLELYLYVRDIFDAADCEDYQLEE